MGTILDVIINVYNEGYVERLKEGHVLTSSELAMVILQLIAGQYPTDKGQVLALAFLLAKAIERLPGAK
jgi:hypothetical protein